MPFVAIELARAIEAAAVDLLRQCALATAQRRPEPAPSIRELGGGIAVLTEPGSPLAKVAGLGARGPRARGGGVSGVATSCGDRLPQRHCTCTQTASLGTFWLVTRNSM